MNRILERLQQKPQAQRLDKAVEIKVAKKAAPVKIAKVKMVDKRGDIDRAAIMTKLREPIVKVTVPSVKPQPKSKPVEAPNTKKPANEWRPSWDVNASNEAVSVGKEERPRKPKKKDQKKDQKKNQ